MPKATFQSIILKLQQFWAEQGCVLWQPYYTQVGAGTMNPATFLRVLGPEPWNVAYVEPSVRPDDGRYGENPNRFQQHTQFQVILKPDPGNSQELYIESLKAIGIDPRQHDIRFVEDNWEQPAISAWGLGWEVWMDGQEITQFTYFQQVGGLPLDPVAVEITYGLERILIALNNAKDIWNEEWAAGVTYGEIRKREEFEHSKYYFEIADVDSMREVFERFEAECKACLENGLVIPAHDYVLKCSHIFNTLDTRGAVGVTERQGYFRRMRSLARQVAETHLEQRKELGYPLLKPADSEPVPPVKKIPPQVEGSAPAPFLLEIGVEELPYADVEDILTQLRERVPVWLAELRLEHGSVRVEATPRRAAVFVEHLSPNQLDREELVKGPPAERAFDADGKPTKAAEGFARGKGVDVSALETRQIDGGSYVVAVVKQVGRPALEVLSEAVPALLAGISFTKSMRWLPSSKGSSVSFSRPIRWFVAMLGETIVPFEYAGVTSSQITRGLRPYGSPEIVIPSAQKYFGLLREAGVVLDTEERKKSIVEQVQQAADLVKGQPIIEDALLTEVAHLVEMPTAVMGGFPQEYLALPREVLISVMKKHQRCFPVEAAASPTNGDAAPPLLPYFVAIRNGDDLHLDIVREGNEHVLNARFADADFFVREDIKHPLEFYRPQLSTLIFQTKLGSMLDKSERMVKFVENLADMLALGDAQRAVVQRAACLSKADLTTQMVAEMTSLQGIIGREYALRSGEKPEVAKAIGEQYQTVPVSQAGLAVALADRIDSLVGLFAAGLAPTGAKDPFALRRAAISTVQALIEHAQPFSLRTAVAQAARLQPIEVDEAMQQQVLDFVAGRLAVLLKETSRYDVVDAVLSVQSDNPAGAARAVEQLQAWVERSDWDTILPGYARCVRIIRSANVGTQTLKVNPEALSEPAEKELYLALQETSQRSPASIDDFLNTIVSLLPAINRFFDDVLVMVEDENLKNNRLGLVQRVAALANGFADLSHLEGF